MAKIVSSSYLLIKSSHLCFIQKIEMLSCVGWFYQISLNIVNESLYQICFQSDRQRGTCRVQNPFQAVERCRRSDITQVSAVIIFAQLQIHHSLYSRLINKYPNHQRENFLQPTSVTFLSSLLKIICICLVPIKEPLKWLLTAVGLDNVLWRLSSHLSCKQMLNLGRCLTPAQVEVLPRLCRPGLRLPRVATCSHFSSKGLTRKQWWTIQRFPPAQEWSTMVVV